MPVYEWRTDQLVVLACGSQQLSWIGSNSFRIAGYVITGELQERLIVLALFSRGGSEAGGHMHAQGEPRQILQILTRDWLDLCTQGGPVSPLVTRGMRKRDLHFHVGTSHHAEFRL
jgi:hypothetical protein